LIHFIMGKRITRMVEKNKKKFEIYEELALLGFVAVPFVGTGAWTGALLSTVLELDAKKSFFVIASGVFLAASIIFLGANGVIYAIE
ncbi:MAG: small multi-drug export protein, partial [Candidatus Aenigmarchaeota archaeon]|nr:small multi-drug export protein [Candidatus Aenigmarchaeota archaeon]